MGRTDSDTRRDPMAIGLAALNKLAGASVLDRWGLRKPVERAVTGVTKGGFQAVAAAGRSFGAVASAANPTRPRTVDPRSAFDLTPTEDQRLLLETVCQ
ncbi:MAG: acyl-CoA dehydrogenase family protein, partial [Sciscionella sp.]